MEVRHVNIDYLGHDGFLITEKNGRKIAIDPYNVSDSVGKVDFILITHGHSDHCSIKDIAKIAREGTVIILPADAQSKITKIDGVQMQIMEVGDELSLEGLKIEAVSAYNVGKDFHPKSEKWLGYLLKFSEVIIYHAGDTDNIPEMEKLTGYGKQGNTFVALLPVSGTYVMTAEEAVQVAKLLNVSIAIPMHYGAGVVGTIEDAQRFLTLCQESGIVARILEKI